METLSTYLQRTGERQTDFAARVGAHNSIISRLARRSILPSLALAARIERATGGAVPASSWIETAAANTPPAAEPGEAAE